MCRIVAYVGVSRPIPVSKVIGAKENAGKKKTIFSLSRDERLHGFGVAWAATDRQFGSLVTLDHPMNDINVRRVCRSVSSRMVIAHLRSCACETCPATTYCGAHLLNTQPLVFSGPDGDVVLAHVGILDHHRALASSVEDPSAKRARSIDLVDSLNSDSAFFFKVALSYYLEDDGDRDDDDERGPPRLARAVASAIFAVSSSSLSKRPSSLNITAADADCAVCCRFRSKGDDKQPPPVWWTRDDGAFAVASAPVSLTEESWNELAPGKMLVFAEGATATAYAFSFPDDSGDFLVPDVELTSRLTETSRSTESESKSRERRKQRQNKEPPSLAETLVRGADAALRGVVKNAFEKYANDDGNLGKVAAKARKRILGDLRRSLSHVTSREEGDRQIEAAKRELDQECERATSPRQQLLRYDLCGDNSDGDVARSIMAETRCSRLEALAAVQAKLYDARFQEAAVGEASSADKAGVEEVKDVMVSEAHAFRSGLRLVFSKATKRVVNVVDFGCGDGRFFAEFERAAVAELDPGSELRVVAYEVSAGALEACRRRCLHDLDFSPSMRERRHGATLLKELVDGRKIVVVFVLGQATTSAREFEALLPRYSYDLVLSGWGSTSAIPDLTEVDDDITETGGKRRRQCEFLAAFARLAPVLVQIVSSANNFVGPNAYYSELRRRRQNGATDKVDALLRLATRPGQFYYTVAGHDYFYSAVDPAQERNRLLEAGYHSIDVKACNVASFRDILASPKLARLERAVLALVDANRRVDLENFLKKAVAKATKSNLATRSSPLFDPNRTLVDQLARYIISISLRKQ